MSDQNEEQIEGSSGEDSDLGRREFENDYEEGMFPLLGQPWRVSEEEYNNSTTREPDIIDRAIDKVLRLFGI